MFSSGPFGCLEALWWYFGCLGSPARLSGVPLTPGSRVLLLRVSTGSPVVLLGVPRLSGAAFACSFGFRFGPLLSADGFLWVLQFMMGSGRSEAIQHVS